MTSKSIEVETLEINSCGNQFSVFSKSKTVYS